MSQTRTAKKLRINPKTVARFLVFLSARCELRFDRRAGSVVSERRPGSKPTIERVTVDEMVSSIHSKLKPVSIPIAVSDSREILGFDVVSMPANGPNAALSVAKYGRRPDHRKEGFKSVLKKLRSRTCGAPTFVCDKNSNYPSWIGATFPRHNLEAYKGRKGCVVGMGELKEGGHDPMFVLNHTAAMLRANVNRLFRRTWCTSKRMDRLKAHISLYVDYHNRMLILPKALQPRRLAVV